MFDLTPQLDCAGRILKLDRPQIMGIVNVTPDSFSDGGAYDTTDAAVAHALQLVGEGADVLDIGGESTRPGADEVSLEEELRRVIPVIERLASRTPVPISIDTSKPEVMRAAVAAGAGMINDVYALRREGALEAAAELGVPVVLMHMLGEPRSMQQSPDYDVPARRAHGSARKSECWSTPSATSGCATWSSTAGPPPRNGVNGVLPIRRIGLSGVKYPSRLASRSACVRPAAVRGRPRRKPTQCPKAARGRR